MWVHDLRDADASCGGKAQGLAKLIAAGLAVPPGFVIADGAFRSIVGELHVNETGDIGHVLTTAAETIATAAIPEELAREVRERAAELGSLIAVRSSATIEDGAAGAAAGVFSSRAGVRVDDVWDAIRAVWTSALTPLAAAYARRRGGTIAIGVIIQEYVAGAPLVVYTRPPAQPGSRELLIQRSDHVSRHSRDDLPREISAQHAALVALRAEQALSCETGVDVELVQLRKQSGFDVVIETSIVQARPIVHPTPRVLTPAPPSVLASLQDGRTWTWDVAHNPDPLSLAQQGLVERVEAAGIAPWSLRVCAGFLYSASRGEPLPARPTVRELQMRAVELEATLEHTLRCDGEPTLAEAIERYLAFYAVWARELSPLIAVARRALPTELARLGHANPDGVAASMLGARESAVEATLFAAARGELDEDDVARHLGCLAPAWDVSVATYGERPGVLRDAIARARRALDQLPGGVRPGPASTRLAAELTFEIRLAQAAAELAERDDTLFARAQLMVRRALLARASSLGINPTDVFWLPLDELATATTLDPLDARRRASGARAAAERAALWQMPLVVGADAAAPPTGQPAALRGHGTGPRVAGRIVRFASLASAVAVGAGDVVVARAITPALAVLVAGCAALVSETGGLLDHGASLARELGIPCVVGCRDAWATLSDGMLVTVDGDGGLVTPTL
jgi:phosphohistidine swiveling domain-containing protein